MSIFNSSPVLSVEGLRSYAGDSRQPGLTAGPSFVSYRYPPGKEEPGEGHYGEVGPGVGRFGGREEGAGGDEAGEDEMENSFHINSVR